MAPENAARNAPGAERATGMSGVQRSGSAESAMMTAVKAKVARGPNVTSSHPANSGLTMPVRALTASRMPNCWPRCSASPSAA